MSLTLQTRFAIALTSLGFVEQKSTARFRVFNGFVKIDATGTLKKRSYYLGKGGSLRWADNHKVSDCRPCSEKTKQRLLALPAVPNKEIRGFLIREQNDRSENNDK